MPEETYVNKPYCLECASKHSNRSEHHFEDLLTATKDDPDMREKAQELLDAQRNIRKEVDEMRIEEKAKQRLQETV